MIIYSAFGTYVCLIRNNVGKNKRAIIYGKTRMQAIKNALLELARTKVDVLCMCEDNSCKTA